MDLLCETITKAIRNALLKKILASLRSSVVAVLCRLQHNWRLPSVVA